MKPLEKIPRGQYAGRISFPHGMFAAYRNNRYIVQCYKVDSDDGHEMTLLGVRRCDALKLRSWTDLQAIKNQLCGHERVAVEYFPPAVRSVRRGEHALAVGLPTRLQDAGGPVAPQGDLQTGGGNAMTEPHRFTATLLEERPKAMKLRFADGTDPVWIPVSQMQRVVKVGSEVTFDLPDWLARDKGLA